MTDENEDPEAFQIAGRQNIEDANVIGVPLEADSIYWNIVPVVREADDSILVDLEWGWSAGQSDEEIANTPDDIPTGKDSVTTTLDMAEDLRDKLTGLIEKHKARHEELRRLANEEFNKKHPNWNEMLEELCDRQEDERKNYE